MGCKPVEWVKTAVPGYIWHQIGTKFQNLWVGLTVADRPFLFFRLASQVKIAISTIIVLTLQKYLHLEVEVRHGSHVREPDNDRSSDRSGCIRIPNQSSF
jgi:hypothetical protein